MKSRLDNPIYWILAFSIVCILAASHAFGAQYYVSTNGSDVANGTAWGTAFQTINHAVSIAGNTGDTITVRAGRFPERITVGKANLTITAEYPAITGQGLDWRMLPTNTVGSSLASCRGFTMDSASNTNVTIRGFEITQIGTGNQRGISLNGAANCTIELNYVHELEPDIYGGDGIGSGAYTPHTTGIIIRSNKVWKVEGSGINPSGDKCLIYANDCQHPRSRRTDGTEIGLDADCARFYGSNNILTNNYFHDGWFSEQGYTPGNGPHMDGLMCFSLGGDGRSLTNNLVGWNFFSDIDDQAIITSDSYSSTPTLASIIFVGNLVWNVGDGGWSGGAAGHMVNLLDCPGAIITNNTFVKFGTNHDGVLCPNDALNLERQSAGHYGCSNSIVRNNIFFGFAGNQGPFLDSFSLVGTTLDYNLYQPNWTWPSRYSGKDANSQFGVNPQFVSTNAFNWHLLGTSPAVGAGAGGVDLGAFLLSSGGAANPSIQVNTFSSGKVTISGKLVVR